MQAGTKVTAIYPWVLLTTAVWLPLLRLVCFALQVRHKNVVQFIGACTRKPNLCIVFEYMSGGSVYDWIRREGPLKLSTVSTA